MSNPELAYWGSLLACAEMIKSGTTTFSDMYIFEEETARAAKEAGMRCLVGEVLFDFPSPNFKTPEEGLAYTERLIQTWADDPLINIMVEPHALYTCSPDLLKASKALADRLSRSLWRRIFWKTSRKRNSWRKNSASGRLQFLRKSACSTSASSPFTAS